MSREVAVRHSNTHHQPVLPLDPQFYIALEIIPEGKDVKLKWLRASQTEETIQDLLFHDLIELEGKHVRITENGELYRQAAKGLIGLEKNGVRTQVKLRKPRKPPIDREKLRSDLFEKSRKYNRISKKEWKWMGPRKQWEKIRIFLIDPQTNRDKYAPVMTPKTKRLLRARNLIK
jgi:hypothetical protein